MAEPSLTQSQTPPLGLRTLSSSVHRPPSSNISQNNTPGLSTSLPSSASSNPAHASPVHSLSPAGSFQKRSREEEGSIRSCSSSSFCTMNQEFEVWRFEMQTIVTLETEPPPSNLFPLSSLSLHGQGASFQFELPISNLPNDHLLFALYPEHRTNLEELKVHSREGNDDPEYVVGLWYIFAEAFRDYQEGQNERAMCRGIDKALQMAFTNRDGKAFYMSTQTDFYLPVEQLIALANRQEVIPNVKARAGAFVHRRVPMDNITTLNPKRCDDTRLLAHSSSDAKNVELNLVAGEYRFQESDIPAGQRQVVMDLSTAVRYAERCGITDITLFGFLVWKGGYHIYTTERDAKSQWVTIKRWPRGNLETYPQFLRLYYIFADMRNSLRTQFEQKRADASVLSSGRPWRGKLEFDGGGGGSGGEGDARGSNGSPTKKARSEHSSSPLARTVVADGVQGLTIQQPTAVRGAIPDFLVAEPHSYIPS